MDLGRDLLAALYNEHRLSMAEIAERLGCSQNKVAYWMNKHGIVRRDISEAIYQQRNPDGDPFVVQEIFADSERNLFQLAIGLYIGEGSKKRRGEVSIANNDARVIRTFMEFLRRICGVHDSNLFAVI